MASKEDIKRYAFVLYDIRTHLSYMISEHIIETGNYNEYVNKT